VISATAPVSPVPSDLWWNTEDGNLYIYYDDGDTEQWVISQASFVLPNMRQKLSAEATYYISPTGDDDTGDGSEDFPWQSMNHAYAWIAGNLDQAGLLVTVQMADGTYDPFEPTVKATSGPVYFLGNAANPENVIVDSWHPDGFDYYCVALTVAGGPATIFMNYMTFNGEVDWSNGYGIFFLEGDWSLFVGTPPALDGRHGGITRITGNPWGIILVDQQARFEWWGDKHFNVGTEQIGWLVYADRRAQAYIAGAWTSDTDLEFDKYCIGAVGQSYIKTILGTFFVDHTVTGKTYDVTQLSLLHAISGVPGDVAGTTASGGVVV